MTQSARRRPASLLRVPVSTYRLQLNADLTFKQAAGVTTYLHRVLSK